MEMRQIFHSFNIVFRMTPIYALLLVFGALAQANSIDWKAIDSLKNRSTFQDGPNCYNAAFLAKGWTKIVSQTADEELKYYLWNFCELTETEPTPGDIFVDTVGRPQDIEHAVTYLGKGMIFEKPSTVGLLGRFAHAKEIGIFHGDLEKESTYAIRSLEDSDYFKEGKLVYRCQPHSQIEKSLSPLQHLPQYPAFLDAKELLSKLSFSTSPQSTKEFKELPIAVTKVVDILDRLRGISDDDLFLYANAESVFAHFYNFQDGLLKVPKVVSGDAYPKRAFRELTDRMSMSLRCLVERIRKARPGPETDYIVRDVSDTAYVERLNCPK